MSFQLQRLGIVMEPEPGNPHEIEGVLNPGAARGPDGRFTFFRASLRGAIFRALASRVCSSTTRAIRLALSVLA